MISTKGILLMIVQADVWAGTLPTSPAQEGSALSLASFCTVEGSGEASSIFIYVSGFASILIPPLINGPHHCLVGYWPGMAFQTVMSRMMVKAPIVNQTLHSEPQTFNTHF